MEEAKKLRDKQESIKKVGDSLGRWKVFMEHGPDKLPTDESEDYEIDSADDAIVPVELKDDKDAALKIDKLHLEKLEGDL